MSEAELHAERRHHDRVRAAMGAMRRATTDLMNAFEADFIEAKKNRYADDAGPDHNLGSAMERYGGQRLEDLADRDIPLFFGRLWLESGEDFHLGRRHVRDEDDRSEALVLDWRAPVAERYYRASVHTRQEVTKRRRFGFRGAILTSFEDEQLDLGQGSSSDLLTAEIERPRTGPMRDIVATIQPEQDELIRRDTDTTLCVQGAPGTGKTAVGLHRAAWLLYTYRSQLERSGMLVIGPNDTFLRYIAGVLPTLGEASVRQLAIDELTGAQAARFADPADVQLIKHDARMAQVCRRAVWSHLGRPTEELALSHGGGYWTLDVGDVADALERVHARSRTWTAGRKALEHALAHGIMRQYEKEKLRSPDATWLSALKRHPTFKAYLEALWPRLTAKQVLRRLYGDADFRSSVCEGVLTPQETDLLRREQRGLKLSAADVVVLDEIQAHLQPLKSDHVYGHIVIDEAQDLSAMQCRAIARRCPHGSLTVLGDLAQGTTPWAATDWTTHMAHLGREGDVEYTELTTGFRVPAVIIDIANRVLRHLDVPVSAARSVRRDGDVDLVTSTDLAAGTRDAVHAALDQEGLVGVIAADERIDSLRAALPRSERVELVPASLAKGLEFDHVVLTEPADFLTPDSGLTAGRGLRHLYVAITRAVSRLTIVHHRPIPDEVGDLATTTSPAPALTLSR